MTTSTRRLDIADLEARVKGMYEQVATEPHQEFHFETGRGLAERLGYASADLDRIPAAAVDSFAGVGYFLDLATLTEGETVLDLGSGSGMDSFLAALGVGAAGAVIGVDMTRAQLAKARALAAGWGNVTFRTGYIEQPPVQDGSIDCVISNGVINLAPDKHAVFAAAAIGGAMQRDRYTDAIEAVGFRIDTVRENSEYRFVSDRASNATVKYGVSSISLLAHRA